MTKKYPVATRAKEGKPKHSPQIAQLKVQRAKLRWNVELALVCCKLFVECIRYCVKPHAHVRKRA